MEKNAEQYNTNIVAKRILNLPKEKQTMEIENFCGNSDKKTFELAHAFIDIAKQIDMNMSENNKKFYDVCEKAIEALSKGEDDKELSEEERKDIKDKIVKIVEMLNKTHNKQMNLAQERYNKSHKKAVLFGVGGAFLGSALTAIAVLLSRKK